MASPRRWCSTACGSLNVIFFFYDFIPPRSAGAEKIQSFSRRAAHPRLVYHHQGLTSPKGGGAPQRRNLPLAAPHNPMSPSNRARARQRLLSRAARLSALRRGTR